MLSIFRFGNIFYALIFSLLLSFSSYGQLTLVLKYTKQAENGIIDLSKASFKGKVYGIAGEWDFVWQKLVEPQQVDSVSWYKVPVPKVWSSYEIDGEFLPSLGYATYRVRVVLPKDMDVFALNVREVFTSYKLYVDGKLIDENGRVGTSRDKYRATWAPKEYVIEKSRDTVEILFQVANFEHFKAGLTRQIVIGSVNGIYNYTLWMILFDAIVIGGLLIMGLYFMFYFYNQPDYIAAIYLSIALLGQAFTTSLEGEFLLYRLFPNMNFVFVLHLLYVVFYYRVVLFAHFFYNLVPQEFNLKMLIGFDIVYFLMSLYCIFAPVWKFGFALNFYMFTGILLLMYILYVLAKSIKYEIGALYTILGVLVVLLTGINDVLYVSNVIVSYNLIGFGVLVFVFTMSIMMAMSAAKAETKTVLYSTMLKKLNYLREELIKVPFYDLSKILPVISRFIDSSRSLWIDVLKDDYKVSYEYFKDGDKIEQRDKLLKELPSDYVNKPALDYTYKLHSTVLISPRVKRRYKSKLRKLLFRYLHQKKIISNLISYLYKKGEVNSLIYFENDSKPFTVFEKRLIHSIRTQLIVIRSNANAYYQLQELNKKLERLVEERTEYLRVQQQELKRKEKDLKEKIEELEVYNEKLNRLHQILEQHKYEIEQQNFELEQLQEEIIEQKKIAEIQNSKLTESLNFAKSLQEAILYIDPYLPFKDVFVLYLPKQIVSGDFYWIRRFGDYAIVALADCTGHGVPGAFMSILGSMLLNQVIIDFMTKYPIEEIKPSMILTKLREELIDILGQQEEEQVKDGMDMVVMIYSAKDKMAKFSGAYLGAIIVKKDKRMIEIKGTRFPIGIYYRPEFVRKYEDSEVKLEEGDIVYLFTDGYPDQYNPQGVKFYRKNMKKLLLEISDFPLSVQKDILLETFQKWKGDYFQIDDVTVIGILI